MDEFEKIAADLEKSIQIDETAAPLSQEAQELLKDPANVRKALALGAAALVKAKGAQPTDLSQEKAVKDDEPTETEADPAKTPVKSGKGYKDTRPYVGKMGKGDESDDDDDDGDGDKPSFFGKKGKSAKKGSKAKKGDESDADGDDVDVTEFVDEMGKAMNYLLNEVHELRKAQAELTEGSAIFGQVLHQIAENDPRRDGLNVTMAKALSFIVGEVKDLRKSFSEQNSIMKAVAEMPGAPRAAGLALIKGEADAGGADGVAPGSALSKGDKERLYGAAVAKSITMDEYRSALKTNDASILQKVKA